MNEVKYSCGKHHYAWTSEDKLPTDLQPVEASLKNMWGDYSHFNAIRKLMAPPAEPRMKIGFGGKYGQISNM